MKLRIKTLCIVIVTLLFLLAALQVSSKYVLLGGFSRVENDAVDKNVKRVLDALQVVVDNLSVKSSDWAKWDDTYKYIENRNKEYIESNLNDESLAELKLNLMMFINKKGSIVFSRAFDLKTGEGFDVPDSVKKAVLQQPRLVRHADEKSVVAGIIHLCNDHVMIVSRPILTSTGEGPVKGALIFARTLDEDEVNQLAQITHLTITLYDYARKDVPADVLKAKQELSATVPIQLSPLSETVIAGYTTVSDIENNPLSIARIEMARDIYGQGRKTMVYLIASILVAGVCFGITILILLEKTVLSRVAKLETEVRSIGTSLNHSLRVKVSGRDELAGLAKSVNTMLGALEKSEMQVRARNREMQMIMNTVPSGLLSINREFRINPEYSHSVETILGMNNLAQKNFIDVIGLTQQRAAERQTLTDYFGIVKQKILSQEELAQINPTEEVSLISPSDQSTRWIKLQYYLMDSDKESAADDILVVVEDITKQKEMAARIKQSEQENMYLKAIAEDPELFKEFLREMRQILSHAEKNMDVLETLKDKRVVVNEIYRDVHTIKGTSGAFCLFAVAQIAGKMEDSLKPLRDTGEITLDMIESTRSSLAMLLRAVMDVVEGAKKILGDDIDSTDTQLRISLNKLKNEYTAINNLLKENLGEHEMLTELQGSITQKFRNLCSVPAQKGLGRALRIIPDLINRLNKQIEFQLEGEDVLIDYEIARELNNPLVHLIRNSFDHGIEDPSERAEAGKREQGKVLISVWEESESIIVKITDDGRGINPEKIKKAAIDKKIISLEKAKTLTREECFNLIFLPGLSTAEKVTDVSGRGVGMDAVIASVK